MDKSKYKRAFYTLFAVNIFLINPVLLIVFVPSIWINPFFYPIEQILVFYNLTFGIFLTPLWLSNLLFLSTKSDKNWFITLSSDNTQDPISNYIVIVLFGFFVDFILFGQNSLVLFFVIKIASFIIFFSLVFVTMKTIQLNTPKKLNYNLNEVGPKVMDKNRSKLIYLVKYYYWENQIISIINSDTPWLEWEIEQSDIRIQINEGTFHLNPLEFEYMIHENLIKSRNPSEFGIEFFYILFSWTIPIIMYFSIKTPTWQTEIIDHGIFPISLIYYIYLVFAYIFGMIIPYFVLRKYFWDHGIDIAEEIKIEMDETHWENLTHQVIEKIGRIDRFSELSIFNPTRSQILRNFSEGQLD